jgi:hypothetical protein
MIRRFSSGWNTTKLPGQFFKTRKELANRLAAGPYSNDRLITDFMRSKDEPAWQPGEVKVVGDAVYDGQDKLLTIKDPAMREEFLADYQTSPDRSKTYSEWRNKLRGAEEAAGLAPAGPERRLRSGGDDEDFEVSAGRWHGRAYVKRIFVPGKEQKGSPAPGQLKKDKPGMIPIYHRGIEMTDVETGDVVKFPLTVRGGVASFGDSRTKDPRSKDEKQRQQEESRDRKPVAWWSQTTTPRYNPRDMVEMLTSWVGPENAKSLVDAAMGGMTPYYATQQASWVGRECKFAHKSAAPLDCR